jgi:hypothetical protein
MKEHLKPHVLDIEYFSIQLELKNLSEANVLYLQKLSSAE